ncbi:MAG: DUF4438 domain-containing protein, partial [FCB group bacterium]|nr:DUF4438 domain-containing protein [FCB group bacterium]
MIKINKEQLVMQAVMGEVSHPAAKGSPYRISADGIPMALPGVGSITYNVKIGDNVSAFKADHVEPGVSIKNKEKGGGVTDPNLGLTFLACIGNQARVITGDAKGDTGVVTGKHGGIEHVMVHFNQDTLEKLVIGDKIQIKAQGLGMEAPDFPGVRLMNIDPGLLEKIGPEVVNGKVRMPVTHLIPAKIMGSGIGKDNAYIGDYDIQMFDEGVNKEFHLDTLRFGDIVAITDADNTWGRIWREGSISIGVVGHFARIMAGLGPGA